MLPETELLKLERAFMRALREPVFGNSRDLTPLPGRAGRVSDEFQRTAQRYIQPSTRLEPVERLELYHRQYWFRLLDSMAEDFPTLKRLLGEETFWRLVEAYLEAVPSQSYTLRHLGSRLADFAAQHPALAGKHPRHAIELARLEYAVCEVFEAADEPVIEPDRLAVTPLSLQPHLKLFGLTTPVDALWRLADDAVIPEEWLREPEAGSAFYVAVFREDYRLRVERLPREAFLLLCGIQRTGALQTALEACGLDADAPEEFAGRVRDWFTVWTARGWFCARQPSPTAFASANLPSRARRGRFQSEAKSVSDQTPL